MAAERLSAHRLFMKHGNAIVRSDEALWPNRVKGFWSRRVPDKLPNGITDPYPCAIASFMTPVSNFPLTDDVEIPEYSELIYIIEAHSQESMGDADDINEILLSAFHKSEGLYTPYGRIESCMMLDLTPDLIDDRRGGNPVYRIGYKYKVMVTRVI